MSTHTEERFDIAFAGDCLEGHDPAAVREALGALFKANESTLTRLFSGTRQRIKRNCDKATALKYQKSMASVGAKAIITRASDSSDAPPPQGGAVASKGDPATQNSLQALPSGSDILRPDERRTEPPASLDLGHLSLAETGERLGPDPGDDAAPVNAPDFDLAAPGERLGPEVTDAPLIEPDISTLDLAPLGEDMGEDIDDNMGADLSTGAKADGVQVSTAHLNLAEPGSDLLHSTERKVSNAKAPDTSHLTLESGENTESS